MNRYFSYLQTATTIIEKYHGLVPFAIFIKQFFAADKKYGSKDRKQISNICYNYYRIGFIAKKYTTTQAIINASFLCETMATNFLSTVAPSMALNIEQPIQKKLSLLNPNFTINDIAACIPLLSKSLDVQAYLHSFFIQPSTFVRIRPLYKNKVVTALQKANINYQLLTTNCIQVQTTTNIADVCIIDKEVVIQDYNSQSVFDNLAAFLPITSNYINVWDCCAASGGKSILLHDVLPNKIKLTVSDIRPSIISNLKKRFAAAGIKNYKSFVADISNNSTNLPIEKYDIIVCDVPCSGSGTWSRTPEQLSFFNNEQIEHYSQLQKKITAAVIPFLKQNGLLVYITCSVFEKENEAQIDYLVQHQQLTLLHSQLLQGANNKADSMYVAILTQ
jgi:16S rRNA (cytosine967-C5)-methyltransferase